MNFSSSESEHDSFSKSRNSITPPQRNGKPELLFNENKNLETPPPHLLVRPLTTISSFSSSSYGSLRSYETPVASPKPSPLEPVPSPTHDERETICIQQPPTPTPPSRTQHRVPRLSYAGIKPQFRKRRPNWRTKATQTSIRAFLSAEKNLWEPKPMTSTVSGNDQPLGDTFLTEPEAGNQASHEPDEEKIKGAGVPSGRNTSPVTEELLSMHVLHCDENDMRNGKTEEDNTALDSSPKQESHFLIPGSFPEELCFSSITDPEDAGNDLSPQTLTTCLSTSSETDLLHEGITPYPHFKRRYTDKSQHSMHQKISAELQTPLSNFASPGYLYIYEPVSRHVAHIKIGRAAKETDQRIKQQRLCNMGKVLKVWQHALPVPNHERLERLIHIELANLNYTFKCWKCKKKDKTEPLIHQEWFLLQWETACVLIERWSKWMAAQDPYDRNGDLRPFWRERLRKYQWTGSVEPHKLRDMSGIIWTLEDTALHWDRWTRPMTVEIWWFHFRRIILFSWSFGQLCIMALMDPVNSRTAMTFLVLMALCSFTLPMEQSAWLGAVFWMLILLPYLHQGSSGSHALARKKRSARMSPSKSGV